MTQIFKSYSDFLSREDKKVNGVDQDFADEYPDFEKQNEMNEGCWNCSGCSNIAYLRLKENLNPASTTENPIKGFPDVPVIENVHQKVFEAVQAPKALNMETWHICDTTHCRAGWVVFLAGQPCRDLELHTSTQFAAMQIY